MNVKFIATFIVALMMCSGFVVLADSEQNDATGENYCLFGMGSNGSGKLGNADTTTNVTTPTQIGEFMNVSFCTMNGVNTYFIDSGKLYGMGSNSNGQMGNADKTTNVTTPTQIGSFTNVSFVITSGGGTTIFIDSGKLYGMGKNNYNFITDVSTDDVTTPMQIGSFTNVTSVALTTEQLFFIDSGKLYGVGHNNHGQMGDGTTANFTTPTQIGSFTNVTFVAISKNTTFFIDSGKLYGMGANASGQQGDGTTTEVRTTAQVGEFANVTFVSNGDGSTFFIDSGKLYGMGKNNYGQLGNADTTTNVTTPTQIGSFTNVTSINSSLTGTIFIDSGKLYGMGQNSYGQLGNADTTTNVTTPTQIGSFTNVTVLNYNGYMTYFIDSGKLYGMGYNSSGQQGDGTTTNVTTPTQIGSFTNVISVNTLAPNATVFISSPASSSVSVSSNNTDYGTVDGASITAAVGDSITVSNNTLTIGEATVTATPTTDTDQYDYSFTGWYNGDTKILNGSTVTEGMTITAVFERAVQKYTVTLASSNTIYGKVSPSSLTVDYGTAITLDGNNLTIGSTPISATPSTDTKQWAYSFEGWTVPGDVETVTAPITITATFQHTIQTYTITWVIGETTETETYEYGQIPHHDEPTAPEGKEFFGWSPAVKKVTGNATYTAIFSEPINDSLLNIIPLLMILATAMLGFLAFRSGDPWMAVKIIIGMAVAVIIIAGFVLPAIEGA